MKKVTRSEWVVLGFLFLSASIISLKGSPEWASARWVSFPIFQIFFVCFAGTFIKTWSQKEGFGVSFWRELRTLLPLILMFCAYPMAPLLIHSLGLEARDVELTRADQWLFAGNNPQLLIEPWIRSWLSEWMAFAYSMYAFLLLGALGLYYLQRDSAKTERLTFTLTLAFALGYLGYAAVPALGPVFTQSFSVPLDLYYMQSVKDALMDRTRIEYDCFPSLHTAISACIGLAFYRDYRKIFWVILPVLISIPIACVYLRYHYVTDVIAGLVLAGLCHHLNKVIPVIAKARL